MRAPLLLLAACSLGAPAFAAGVTGADVLKTKAAAPAAALGEAGVAASDDVGAFSYNPAGLARIKGPELGFLHFSQVANVGVEDLSYAHPLPFGTVGASLLFRGQPDIVNPLATDAPVGAFDLVLALGGATRPGKWLPELPGLLANADAGITVKYLRSHLGRYDADAFAIDAGIQAALSEDLRLGLAVQNVGPPIKFIEQGDPLPATLTGGIERRFDPHWGQQLNVLADVEAPLQGTLRLHFGAEDWMGDSFALRAGYILDNAESLNGLTAGFGVQLNQEGLIFDFDYAFRPYFYDGLNSFEGQHLFGVQLGF
jgi:hypothetical protein